MGQPSPAVLKDLEDLVEKDAGAAAEVKLSQRLDRRGEDDEERAAELDVREHQLGELAAGWHLRAIQALQKALLLQDREGLACG